MKSFGPLFLILFLLTACSSEEQKIHAEIAKMEEALKENADPAAAQTLIDKYLVYVEEHPDDHEMNGKYLYRAAELDFRMNRITAAVDYLTQALRDHYSSSATFNIIEFLGTLYQEKLANQGFSNTVFQAAAKAFPDKQQELSGKIQQGIPPLDQRLESLGQSVFNETTNQIEYRAANDFITSCTLVAMVAPKDAETPDLLYKASETARSIRAYSKAIELYDWILNQYPDSQRAEQILFLKAFTLENDLQKIDEARATYEDFIQRFPESELVKDAKFLLENLGKDEEEIIKSFEQQPQQQ